MAKKKTREDYIKAAPEVTDEAAKTAMELEKLLCAALGKEWHVDGRQSVYTLVHEICAKFAALQPEGKGSGNSDLIKCRAMMGCHRGSLPGQCLCPDCLAEQPEGKGR